MRASRRARDERGVAMVMVVFLTAMLAVIGVTLIDTMRGESNRSVSATRREASLDAAEAGIDDYITKLTDDSAYFLQLVHPGEATRRATDGTLVAAGAAWTGGTSWTYANGKNAWRQLGNGFEYNLEITPPSATSKTVTILATGRPASSTNTGDWRVIQVVVRP